MNVAIHGPDPARRTKANRAGLRSLVLDTATAGVTRVIRDQGRVVGGFVAVRPDEFPLPAPRWLRQLQCLLGQGARAMDQWGHITQELLPYHPDSSCWYVAILGVSPSLHNQGFGSRLIEALLALRASASEPIYLESDRAESVRFYRARGFEVRDAIRVSGVDCWCLGRDFAGAD